MPSLSKSYEIINILNSGEKYDIDNINDDDTNLNVLNKICIKINKKILIDELFCYVNENKIIGFSYENANINNVLKNNNIILDGDKYIDYNFVDKLGNKKNVYVVNEMNNLFENNFPIKDKKIYYFTLNDLINLKELDNNFIYSVINKFFPNVTKNYIETYSDKINVDKRNEYIKKTKNILKLEKYVIGILKDNQDDILKEQKYLYNLLNFKCGNLENDINIINLFSEYKLSSKVFCTKLIRDDYNESFYKLYKPELKLKLSDDKYLNKNICEKILNDYSDNVSLPFDYKYIPPSLQPRNCLIFKIYIKEYKLFYSFILFKDGSYDFIINNYNNLNITDELLDVVKNNINDLINDINRSRIYTKNKIPILNDYNDKINFINCKMLFSMDNFLDEEGKSVYNKKNLLKYLENFYTHIRVVKEKMELNSDSIILKYKRVNNYENVNTIQSIISVLYNPDIEIPDEEFIEIISNNTGISINDAKEEYIKWVDSNEKNEFKRRNVRTNEMGAEIIMNRYLDNYISFEIYNVQSREELNRILHFIKVFMKLYEKFIKKQLKNKKYKYFFTQDLDKREIELLQEQQQLPEFVVESQPVEEELEELDKSESIDDEFNDLIVMTSSESSEESLKSNKSESLKSNKSESLESNKESSSESLKSNKSGTDDGSSLSSLESQGGGGIKVNDGKDSYHFLNNLKNIDPLLFTPKTGAKYPVRCGGSYDGIRIPIPVYKDDLDRMDKNDILKTVRPKLTLKEINDYILSTSDIEELKQVLSNKNIKYSEEFPSYSKPIKQTKIGGEVDIYYICPKYYDISRRVCVHPIDIYDQLDNVIPPKFKGVSEKTIISNEGKAFRLASSDNIKKILLDYLKFEEIYNLLDGKISAGNLEDLKKSLDYSIRIIKPEIKKAKLKKSFDRLLFEEMGGDSNIIKKYKNDINKILQRNESKLLAMDLKKFNDYIINKIPQYLYELFHKDIVKYHQPRFFEEPLIEGKKLPCCFTYKEGMDVDIEDDDGPKKPKLELNDKIYISELSPCNYNKFGHIHSKLQELFDFNKDFNDVESFYGGFVKYGVEQGNDALINVLSNFEYRQNITNTTKYKKGILYESLNDKNSLLRYMKCGDGYILQSFKTGIYNYYLDDIEYFIKYIKNVDNRTKFEKINIKIDEYTKELNELKNINKLTNKNAQEFKDIVYNSKNNIKFLYELIISKKNYENWLKSNEIKDYKYILPLVSEINKDNIYILFENNDDIINIRLPLNTYDIFNDNTNKHIYFIYKEGDVYEALYYLNENRLKISYKKGNEKILYNCNNINLNVKIKGGNKSVLYDEYFYNNGKIKVLYENNKIKKVYENKKEILKSQVEDIKIDCDIRYNMYENKELDKYLNNILDGIINKIKDVYRTKDEDVKFFDFETLKNQLDDEPKELFVDNYSKVSHVITNKGYIYPIIPSKIPLEISSNKNKYKLIYEFSKKPTFEEFKQYSRQKIIRNKLKIKGFIVNNNKIINIVFKNETYIPIDPVDYDNKNKYMKYPILGEKDLFLLDKDLHNFIIENDERYEYNTDVDYLNYITNLTIQNIIYYLKEEKNNIKKSYYTLKDISSEDYEIFKIIPMKNDKNKPINLVEIENRFFNYYYEENRFRGKIVNRKNPVNKLQEIIIEKSLLDEIYLIINNSIKINYDKQNELYEFINSFINEIVVELSDEEYDKYKKDKNISICFDNSDKCIYPCFTDKNKCKLYVKKSDIYDAEKSLINKIVYKLVDLLLIHKNIEKINSILQDNININDLYKTVKEDEIFFNYLQYQNKYINELFNYESSFIRNINFYDRENVYLNSSKEVKPIQTIMKGVPNIINKLFKYNKVITYIDDENTDFKSLEYSLTEINNEEISIEKIKADICKVLDKSVKNKDNIKKIISSYLMYDKEFKLTSVEEIKENINKTNYSISPFDLDILAKDIGFLLISSKYSEQNPSKLKYNIIMKYNNKKVREDTKFVLLYHYYSNDKYNLSNILVKNNDDIEEYKSYLTLKELKEISEINEEISVNN
jgi:hypothetical protein